MQDKLTVDEILDVLDQNGKWYKRFVEKHGFKPSVPMALHYYLKERDKEDDQPTLFHEKTVRELIDGT